MSLFTSNKDKNQPLQFLMPAFLQGLSSEPGGNLTDCHVFRATMTSPTFWRHPLPWCSAPLHCARLGAPGGSGVSVYPAVHVVRRGRWMLTWLLMLPGPYSSFLPKLIVFHRQTRLHVSLYSHLFLQLYPGTYEQKNPSFSFWNRSIDKVNFDHLAEVYLLVFSTVMSVLLPLFHNTLFGRNTLCKTHPNRVGSHALLPAGQRIYINYLEFFCIRDTSILFHFQMCLFLWQVSSLPAEPPGKPQYSFIFLLRLF